jgi:hypothetical protein
MIVYTCANCERELEIDDQLGGQRVRCPHCQNVEVAPMPKAAAQVARVAAGVARPASGKGTPAAAAMAAAPGVGSGAAGVEPERELARVHPVMIRAKPVLGSVLVLTVVGGIALAIAAQFTPGFANYRWSAWGGVAVAVVAAVWLGWWKVGTRATTVVITNRRTIVHRGLFSRSSKELKHEQVMDIQITQTFPQRMLRVGTLGLDGGGTDDVEIVVEDLPDPARLRELVDGVRG